MWAPSHVLGIVIYIEDCFSHGLPYYIGAACSTILLRTMLAADTNNGLRGSVLF